MKYYLRSLIGLSHKSGIIPIYPKFEFSFDGQGKLVQSPSASGVATTVNQLVQDYGQSDMVYEHFDSYGPSLGPAGIQRSKEFIQKVTSGMTLDETSYPKIMVAMQCSNCHNDFAKLNYLQGVRSSRDVQAFESHIGMIQTFIQKGYMPPKNTLTDNERTALWKCLMVEYFNPTEHSGIFVDWLKGDNSNMN